MVRQIIFAVIIAIPVAAYLTDQYIQNFSVRTPVEFWHYVAPVGILLVIMCGTITSVLWKAARTNPVESLRYE
jgi:putative ABC transport system permease protein